MSVFSYPWGDLCQYSHTPEGLMSAANAEPSIYSHSQQDEKTVHESIQVQPEGMSFTQCLQSVHRHIGWHEHWMCTYRKPSLRVYAIRVVLLSGEMKHASKHDDGLGLDNLIGYCVYLISSTASKSSAPLILSSPLKLMVNGKFYNNLMSHVKHTKRSCTEHTHTHTHTHT